MILQSITPTIQVTDLRKAISFYQKLEFSEDWRWPESNPTHASISNNGHNFMIVRKDETKDIQRADLYFTVSDIKVYHQAIISTDLEIPTLQLTDYGMLDFTITDPWGYLLTFGSPSGEYKPS